MVDDPSYEREGRGRSEKKKAARAVEALAVRMVESSDALCKRFPLTDEVRRELDQARKITSRTARKRQLKHLAGMLRRDDEVVVGVQSVFDAEGRVTRAQRESFHEIESLRDALCDPTRFHAALEKAAAELPDLDRHRLTKLAARVHENNDKSAAREIFRNLRALMEGHSNP